MNIRKPDADEKVHSDVNLAERFSCFSLERRITIFVIFLTLIVMGSVAISGLKRELIPEGMTGKSIGINIRWRDASPQEVLEKIIIPLEDELSTVKGLENLNSNARTGLARVNIRFKVGVDESIAYREVRDRVERARIFFPDDVEKPVIRKASTASIPIYTMGIILDDGLLDFAELLEREFVMPLERIDGVANVDIGGLNEKELIIEVDRAAIEASGLNPLQVSRALSKDNFTLASGHTYDVGKKYFLRSIAKYTSIEDIENRLIAPNIRLKDISKVSYKESERAWNVRVNGSRAVWIRVFKEGSANTIEVSDAVKDVLEKIKQKPSLQFVDTRELFSQGDTIKNSLGNLIDSGRLGVLLAAVVLFFFLRRVRLTVIVALSIPLSLVVGLSAMYFVGQTLNVFTMLALVICVGLLVDNTVVVAENIFRRYTEDKLSIREACTKGAGEIALAIVTSTLTTIVVFLPVSLIEGRAQFSLQQISIPITSALIGSLLVAFVFVPLCLFLTLESKNDGKKRPKLGIADKMRSLLSVAYDHSFLLLNKYYVKALSFFIIRRIDLIFLLVVVFASIQFFVKKSELEMGGRVGGSDQQVQIRFNAPKGISEVDNEGYLQLVEKTILEKKDQWQAKDIVMISYPRGGRLEAWFDKDIVNQIDMKKTAAEMAKLIPEKAGYRLHYGQDDDTDDEQKPGRYLFTLQGENPELLKDISEELLSRMLLVEGVIGMKGSEDSTPNEMALIVDRDRVAQAQVESEDVARVVSNAIRGMNLPKYYENGREIDMRVRFQEEDRKELDDIGTFYVRAADNTELPIDAVTQKTFLKSSKFIWRRDKKITYRVTLELEKEKTKSARKELQRIQSSYDLPEGVSYSAVKVRNTEAEQMKFAMILSAVLIYLLMGFLFESFLLPLSIICTIPLAFIGVQVGHLIFGMERIDELGLMGCLLLMGVVVNNGIVLIDYVQRLRQSGVLRNDALILAVKQRFRPITMTALTTIVGMIPLALSPPGAMGISYTSFGVSLIVGMAAATVLTLLVVPVFYSLLDDFKGAAMNLISRAFLSGKKTHQ